MLTLSTYIGIPITVLILAVLAFLLVKAIRWQDHDDFYNEKRWAVAALIVSIVGTLAVFTAAWWPFDMDYHRWHEKTGTVELAERRLLGGESGMSEVFVIRFEGDATLYRCDDTRCALATKGKPVRLLCKPVWEYAAVDGWACRYGQEA